ncbi:MAG: DctP family TRAP transporter solute-binding subunit [Acidobacteria bacterium]|nr:DctP family TRAP transporter solute-binding subunit [Acidobacteriota bacterium]
MRRKALNWLSGLAVVTMLAGCFAQPSVNVVRIPMVDGPQSPKYLAFKQFAAELNRRRPGIFRVEVFPSATLGGETDFVKGVQAGSYQLTSVSAGVLAAFVPELQVLDVPFSFRSEKEARVLLDGPLGRQLLASFGAAGVVGLAFWEQGFRSITTGSRLLVTPDDFNGLKLRTMKAPVHGIFFRAMGANPTPMEWGQVYTALQTGQIDGQENPPSAIIPEHIPEVQKHIFLTRHIYDSMPVIASKAWFDGLDAVDKAAVLESMATATAYERKTTADRESTALDDLRRLGMEVHEMAPAALRELREKARPAAAEYIRVDLAREGIPEERKVLVERWLAAIGVAPLGAKK